MASKTGLSLEAMMAADLGKAAEAKAGANKPTKLTKATRSAKTADVVTFKIADGETNPAQVSQAIDKVTVYIPRPVYRFIKQTALELEKRPHDLLMQGIDLLLAQHGKSLKDFTGK